MRPPDLIHARDGLALGGQFAASARAQHEDLICPRAVRL